MNPWKLYIWRRNAVDAAHIIARSLDEARELFKDETFGKRHTPSIMAIVLYSEPHEMHELTGNAYSPACLLGETPGKAKNFGSAYDVAG